MIFPDPKVDPLSGISCTFCTILRLRRAPTQPIGRIITLLRAVKADHQRWEWTLQVGTLLHWGMAAPSGRCMRDILGLCKELVVEIPISVV